MILRFNQFNESWVSTKDTEEESDIMKSNTDLGEEYLEAGPDEEDNAELDNTINELIEIAITAVSDLGNINKDLEPRCNNIIAEIKRLKNEKD